MSCCAPAVIEITCEATAGVLWFECAYSGCHSGVGNVKVYSGGGAQPEIEEVNTCPQAGSSGKKAWVNFDATRLNQYGGRMTVRYGEAGSCACCGHSCNGALFNWGWADNVTLVKGVAYLDNSGGANDKGPTLGAVGHQRFNEYLIPPSQAPTPQTLVNIGVIGGGVQVRRCFKLGNTCGTSFAIVGITTLPNLSDRTALVASQGWHPVTITTDKDNPIVAGDKVLISNVMSNTCSVSVSGNGSFIVDSVLSTTTFVYRNPTAIHGVNAVYRITPTGCGTIGGISPKVTL